MLVHRKSSMKYQTVLYALSLLIASCQSLSIGTDKANSVEFTDRQHNHLDDSFPSEDLLIRNVRKDQSQGSVKPYLLFRSKPPMTVTVKEYDGYTLECEATGNPRPQIHWTINNRIIPQGSPNVRIQTTEIEDPADKQKPVADEENGRTLGLTLVKSRLFLDCITRNKHQAVYGCVAVTPNERHVAHSKVIVRPAENAPDTELVFQHQVLDSQHTNSISQPSKARTCAAASRTNGSPARIFFWTATNLEFIGSKAILHCRADGFPRPQIQWYDSSDNEVLTSGRFQILSSGDLHIRNVTFDEMGKYRCVAKNIHGTDSVDNIFLYPTSDDDKDR